MRGGQAEASRETSSRAVLPFCIRTSSSLKTWRIGLSLWRCTAVAGLRPVTACARLINTVATLQVTGLHHKDIYPGRPSTRSVDSSANPCGSASQEPSGGTRMLPIQHVYPNLLPPGATRCALFSSAPIRDERDSRVYHAFATSLRLHAPHERSHSDEATSSHGSLGKWYGAVEILDALDSTSLPLISHTFCRLNLPAVQT